MNGERGLDSNTDFQRALIRTTITKEPTQLLQNLENTQFIYNDNPIILPGYINYHLHIIYPEYDKQTGYYNKPIKGNWCVEYLPKKISRNGQFIGPGNILSIYDPNIMVGNCYHILASTAYLVTELRDNIPDIPGLKESIKRIQDEQIYRICPSLIEEYVKFNGKLEYVMVHPLYARFSKKLEKGMPLYFVKYKKDANNCIAVFSAIAYNRANLRNQLY
jgi:hypothetical protein